MPSLDRTPVYVLHDNPEWIPPLAEAFTAEGVELIEWPLTGGAIDLAAPPPPGVFWSRLSASSHTRGNVHAKEQARATLRWLESHGRRVVGGSDVLELEVSKVAQHAALRGAGFDVPRTIAVFVSAEGADPREQARTLQAPFITKHNQGGKGLGVQRFDSHDEFDAAWEAGSVEQPVDGILLLQEYIASAEPFITRAEFVGGQYLYAVRVDTSGGSFELCPAEACALPQPGLAPATCAVPGAPDPDGPIVSASEPAAPEARPMFERRDDVDADHPLITQLTAFLRAAGIEIAGVEFIETADGRLVPYDINTNTNYNPDVESDGSVSGARAVARFLGGLRGEAASGSNTDSPVADARGGLSPALALT
ncbi:ATP-grasp domain-containing protein [Pseudoclavibacter endophyticus]|uniref:ATP-grasp domain-containing protein n=1 Tax=Pseudoclavibacter endophyticus TaxID=1778590 RepID=UPI001CE4559E|nr:alpha-L-glutamate ligase [Pseudoclavibacter endophyticus]